MSEVEACLEQVPDVRLGQLDAPFVVGWRPSCSRGPGFGASRAAGPGRAPVAHRRGSVTGRPVIVGEPARSSGSGEVNSSLSPRVRVGERQPLAVQELALEAVAARRGRSAGRRATGWPIAAKWARIWCVRPVSSRASTRVSAGQRSRAPRNASGRRARHARPRPGARARGGRGPAARRSCPTRERGPALDQRQVAALDLAPADRLRERRWASSPRATIIRPEVSLSRRWTMPGRTGIGAAAQQVAKHVDQGLAAVSGSRVDDQAGGLVDNRQPVVGEDNLGPRAHPGAGSVPSPQSAETTSAIAPNVIATSARLKAGHRGGSMKSVTRVDPDPVDQVAQGASQRAVRPRAKVPAARARRRTRRACAPSATSGHDQHQGAAVAQEAEGDPLVGDQGQVEAEGEVDPLAGLERARGRCPS